MTKEDWFMALLGACVGAILLGIMIALSDKTPRDDCYLKNVNGIYCAVCPGFKTVACLQHKPEWDTEAK